MHNRLDKQKLTPAENRQPAVGETLSIIRKAPSRENASFRQTGFLSVVCRTIGGSPAEAQVSRGQESHAIFAYLPGCVPANKTPYFAIDPPVKVSIIRRGFFA